MTAQQKKRWYCTRCRRPLEWSESGGSGTRRDTVSNDAGRKVTHDGCGGLVRASGERSV